MSIWSNREIFNLEKFNFNVDIDLCDKGYAPYEIGCDNQAAIKMAESETICPRTKHIAIRADFIREQLANGLINLYYVNTHENLADAFTKPTPYKKLQELVQTRISEGNTV